MFSALRMTSFETYTKISSVPYWRKAVVPFAYIALWVKLAMLSQGITVTEPSQFQPMRPYPLQGPRFPHAPPQGPRLPANSGPTSPGKSGNPPQQELPIGHENGIKVMCGESIQQTPSRLCLVRFPRPCKFEPLVNCD